MFASFSKGVTKVTDRGEGRRGVRLSRSPAQDLVGTSVGHVHPPRVWVCFPRCLKKTKPLP